MKGFLEEYGLIIVVVAVILLMLLFGKTGYAKSIQDAILGSADHIVETGENITKKDKITASDTIDIEGTKYIVLERRENSHALVMTTSSIGEKEFQSTSRSDGQNRSTYEGSDIDNYLENEWYNSLSSTVKAAIQPMNIKQVSYAVPTDPDSIRETGYGGQVYNIINRHVFLPSVNEIGKVVDLKNKDKIKVFLNGTTIWTRDSHYRSSGGVEVLHHGDKSLGDYYIDWIFAIRPTFVIDLSKVDYTAAGHVDYK